MSHTKLVNTTTTRGRGTRSRGAGPFSIVRSLADHNQTPVRRSDALNRIVQEYEVKRREHEEKEKEKLEKKRQEKLKRYDYVDNGHEGYRFSDGFLDEATGYAPGIAQYFESEEDVRERQQLQLQIDALVYKKREEKERELKKKREEEKKKQKLATNKHIDLGYKLGYESTTSSGLPIVESQEDVRKKQQQKLEIEALLRKEKGQMDHEIQHTKDKENQKLKLEKNNYIDAGHKLGSAPILGASHGDAVVDESVATEDDLLTQEEERLRQEAIFFQEQARLAEERLRELNEKKREKKSEETKRSIDMSNVDQIIQTNKPGPNGDAPVLKPPPQMFKTVLNDILGPDQMEPFTVRQAQTKFEQVEHTTPASCVLNDLRKGPVLVLRPSAADLLRAVGGRIEVQDEVDKLGHSALYTPNVHPEPEFQHNKFDASLTLADGRSTGAIPKKIAKLQKKNEPLTALANNELAKADIVSSAEPVIDHQTEMRAARLRMQLMYEQSLKLNEEEAK